jgi:hypothetical protein
MGKHSDFRMQGVYGFSGSDRRRKLDELRAAQRRHGDHLPVAKDYWIERKLVKDSVKGIGNRQ